MREETGSALVKWLLGCAVVAIICVVVLIIGVYFGSKKLFEQGAKEIAGQIKTEYDALKAANKVPAEHTALFDDLVAVSQDPTASFWTTTFIMLATIEPLQDGEVSESEAKQATTIRDFVKSNPDCTLLEFTQFFSEHPELQDLQQRAQRMGANPPSSMTEPTTTPEPAPATP